MADFTKHQKKIVDRYYDQRDNIMVTKLSELVSELYLAESDKKKDQLWKRAELAMRNLKWKEPIIAHQMAQRRPDLLANQIKEWMAGQRQ